MRRVLPLRDFLAGHPTKRGRIQLVQWLLILLIYSFVYHDDDGDDDDDNERQHTIESTGQMIG